MAGRSLSFGTFQLLANVYQHYVFDLWIEAWRKKVARGHIIVVRYADDLVVGFESPTDAELFLKSSKNGWASSAWS